MGGTNSMFAAFSALGPWTWIIAGVVVQRGVVGAPGVEDGALGVGVRPSGPKVALAISAMPAREPSTPVTSIGMISTFWFGAPASWPRTFMYFSATK